MNGTANGSEWHGEWLTAGVVADLDLGDIIVVGGGDWCGVKVYCVATRLTWSVGAITCKPYLCEILDGGGKWGAELAAEARKWLAMSTDERAAQCLELRLEALDEFRDRAIKDDQTLQFCGHRGSSAISPIEAIIDATVALRAPANAPDNAGALVAERAALVARIAEIDAALQAAAVTV